MREIVAISSILLLLAVVGSEARPHSVAKTCYVSPILALYDDC